MMRTMSQCDFCLRLKTAPDDEIVVGKKFYFCEAFLDGIPDDIFEDKHNHTEPYPNDNGILFLPDGEEATEIQRSLFERT